MTHWSADPAQDEVARLLATLDAAPIRYLGFLPRWLRHGDDAAEQPAVAPPATAARHAEAATPAAASPGPPEPETVAPAGAPPPAPETEPDHRHPEPAVFPTRETPAPGLTAPAAETLMFRTLGEGAPAPAASPAAGERHQRPGVATAIRRRPPERPAPPALAAGLPGLRDLFRQP